MRVGKETEGRRDGREHRKERRQKERFSDEKLLMITFGTLTAPPAYLPVFFSTNF